jgi:hypothetical protein
MIYFVAEIQVIGYLFVRQPNEPNEDTRSKSPNQNHPCPIPCRKYRISMGAFRGIMHYSWN